MRRNALQWILALPFSYRQSKLAKFRPRIDEDEFAKMVSVLGGEEDVARSIHRALGDWTYVEGFTPYPEDSLASVFGIAEEELDEDLILCHLAEMNIDPPDSKWLQQFGPVDTPLRIVQFLSSARERES